MNFLSSAVGRLAQAIGLSSEPVNRVERPPTLLDSAISCPQKPASQSRDIIHIAFLLHHKLPADLVPMILEYAELWETIRLAYRYRPERVKDGQSPRLFAGAVVPYHLPRGFVRLIRFKTISRDQGWSSYAEDYNTYNNSWTWFEAGITGFDEELGPLDCEHHRYDDSHLSLCAPEPGPYKYGNKRIVTNLHAYREYSEHTVEWRADSEDEDIRQMMKELKGGCGIEVTAHARYPGWCNHVKSVVIEIECALVRKM